MKTYLQALSRYIVVALIVGVAQQVSAQNLNVTGSITDADSGEALIGASIVIKGTTNGTVTDFDGNFSVSIPSSGTVLEVSFTGYESQELIIDNPDQELNIKLKLSVDQLQEIVVTGYTSEKKSDLTGAIQVVELERIGPASMSSGNPMQALQGRVPGLYVEKTGNVTGGASRILVRGSNTIGTIGNDDPLFIIDGLPTKRSELFQSLNPSTIKSIQVLKDAASASIYGSRASNGVIIVDTHDGSNLDGKTKVLVNSQVSFMSEKPSRFDMMNAEQRGRALWQASINDGQDPASQFGEIYNFNWNNDLNNPILNGVTVQPFVGGDTNVPAGDTDWQDEFYETAIAQSHDITIMNGDENSSVLVNLGYYGNSGMVKFTNYERLSARINLTQNLFNDKVKFGLNTQYQTSDERVDVKDLGNESTPSLAITLAPTIPARTLDGSYAGPLGAGYSDRNNPVHMQDINRGDNVRRNSLYGNANAKLSILDNLSFTTQLGFDLYDVQSKNIELAFEEGFIARTINSLSEENSRFSSLVWSNFLNYNVDLGTSQLGVLVGIEQISDQNRVISGVKQNFASQDQDFFTLSAGTANGNSFGSSDDSRLLSQFGKINYSLKDKYLVAVTVRRDGSSRFGADNRYGVFPSISAGWKIGDEGFLSQVSWLNSLKIRAVFGIVGNQDIGPYPSLGLFAPRYGQTASQIEGLTHLDFFDQYWNIGTAYDISGANSGNLASGFAAIQAANPSLKWEEATEVNIGVDFAIIEAKLIGSFDYFSRTTDGILIQPPIASAVGEGQIQTLNGATKENKGWEFNLNYFDEVSGDFNYSINLNGSHFKDEITELPEEVRAAFPGNAEQTILGQSDQSIFGYVADGVFQSQEEVNAHAKQVGAGSGRIRYSDLNNDGIVDALDQKFLGTTLPSFEYGIRADVNYKNFDISIFGSGVTGRTGFDQYIFINNLSKSRENMGPGILDAWTPSNAGSSIPAATLADNNNEGRTSTYFMVNTSYFKLRNLQIGYTLPEAVSSRIGAEKIRIYGTADNLFVLKSNEFLGPDPERVNWDNVPVPMVISIGANLTF